MSSRPELKIDWCSHEAAKYACEHWHYSKRMIVGKSAKFGVWKDEVFCGAIVFGSGSSGVGNMWKAFGLTTEGGCELQRVALRTHRTQVSRIIAIALRLLKSKYPGLRLVVSYADPYENHHGGIYQAGGWIFIGTGSATPVWIDRHGRMLHDRSVTPDGIRRGRYPSRCAVKSECTRIDRPPKYKYLMPLDTAMRKQIEPLRKPYPKRVRSVASDTSGDQPGEGGATPTRTLSGGQ